MKLSILDTLLEKRITPAVFHASVAQDIAEYMKDASKLGSVMPVRVDEDQDIKLSATHIKALCEFFIKKQLGSEELAFIADALLLSERVDFEEGLTDLVAEMTDPEINGPFTAERAREILESV